MDQVLQIYVNKSHRLEFVLQFIFNELSRRKVDHKGRA